MTRYALRTLAIAGAPFGFMGLALGGYLAAYQVLPEWWFQTDACPAREMTCGQMPPILFVVLVGMVGLAVVLGAIWRFHTEGQSDV